jgi:hypothetical protein
MTAVWGGLPRPNRVSRDGLPIAARSEIGFARAAPVVPQIGNLGRIADWHASC